MPLGRGKSGDGGLGGGGGPDVGGPFHVHGLVDVLVHLPHSVQELALEDLEGGGGAGAGTE